MTTVADLLAKKEVRELTTIDPNASVFEAIRILAERNLGALIVIEQGSVVGLVTERDYARKVILQGRSSQTTPVRDIMSERIIYVTLDTPVDACMALMTNKYIRHLPVIEDGHLVGIVSIGDVIKSTLGEKDFLINELVRYITDSPMVMREVEGREAHAH